MDEIYTEYSEYPYIPPENMYFITIDDLDYVCALINQKQIQLSTIIEHAKLNDKTRKNRKFNFLQHLGSISSDLEMPEYLIDQNELILSKLQYILMK